jgi:prepilin-type N-terminal cleavage/methylation domain-containing protein
VARTDRLRRLARRIPTDDGFGLIELVIAMSVLAIGLLGMLATFSAGYVTMTRAGVRGTATALADKTMEAYRGDAYAAIPVGTTTATYSGATSPDGRLYTVASVVTAATASNTGGTTARTVKLVTVTVSDATGRQWVREQSTFDRLSG